MPDNDGDELNVYRYYSIFEVLKLNREPCAKVSRYSKKVYIFMQYPQQSLVKTINLGMFNEYNGQLDLSIQHSVFLG